MTSYVASTILMGALAVLVVVAVLRSRRWYTYTPAEGTQMAWAEGHSRPPLHARPTTWIAAFVALIAVAIGGVFLFVTNPEAPTSLLGGPAIAVGGVLLTVYLLIGVYYAAKGRGHPSSIAAAETATVVGVLLLIGVSAQLIG